MSISRVLLDELQKLLPNKISTAEVDIQKHTSSLFYIANFSPDAVCYAESDKDVMMLVDFCIKYKIPIVPYGSGTSVEGHIAAIHGGICLDLSKMNKVLEFKPEDGYVIVQPGISYNKLNEYLEPYGFHFPVEAGWGASIGGMVATNASGAGAVDAGSMAKNVITLEVIVYKNGKSAKIYTGSKSKKSSAGYHLTDLFVGSEGTLGVITEVGLTVRKNFRCNKTILCQFDDIEQAIKFVISTKSRVQYRRVELLDKLQTNACVTYSDIHHLEKNKNSIIIELAGNTHSVEEESSIVIKQLHYFNASNINLFENKNSSEKIWMMRKQACHAAIQMIDPNKKAMATDVSVPLSQLANCILSCYEHMKVNNIIAPLVAHIGDGNFHFTILVDPNNSNEISRANEFNKKVVEEALKVGGTCTGEHGIGFGKIAHLRKERENSIFIMESIKTALDPYNIFNPGKIIELRHVFYSKYLSSTYFQSNELGNADPSKARFRASL